MGMRHSNIKKIKLINIVLFCCWLISNLFYYQLNMYIFYKVMSVGRKPERLLNQFKREVVLCLELGNQRPYSQKKTHTVQTGLGHDYVSILSKQNQQHRNKLKMKTKTKINPNPNQLHPDWSAVPMCPCPGSPCLHPSPQLLPQTNQMMKLPPYFSMVVPQGPPGRGASPCYA